VRPFWLVIWRPIEARIRNLEANHTLAARIGNLEANHTWEARIGALESHDETWRQHVPAFLNAVSTVGAFGHELLRYRKESLAGLAALDSQLIAVRTQLDEMPTGSQDISELAARIEFVRREILFEMKYAGPDSLGKPTAPPPSLQPRVISADKLAVLRQSGLRINLGCGHIPLDGYLNIDMRALPGVDIIAEAGNVPFEPGAVKEVHSAHLLEHFPQEELRRRLLPYWLSLLAPGGAFRAIVPDGKAMLAHFAAGDYPFDEFREVLFGAQDYNGDFHFNMFLPQSLQALLEEAGFVDIQVPVEGRRNGLCYEFEINAQRP
jgi:hypothetical protein